MNQDMRSLISGYLDGLLTEDQEAEVNAWVKGSPENARRFVDAVQLHDRLRDNMRAEQVMEHAPGESALPIGSSVLGYQRRSWRRSSVVGGLAGLVAMVLLAVWWRLPASLNAATELDRLIENSVDSPDRIYLISNLDLGPEQVEERRPPIDGARLYVRHNDQYVLIRRFPDGRSFVTGSDGERSWSVPPEGAVRLSGDPMRFRGPVPGNQHGIPFVNLRSDLVQLRDAYFVTVGRTSVNGWRALRAEKRSPEYRGPNVVEIWYEAKTGVIHRMVFDGMPRARGGPNSVAVELLEQRNLGANFFQHESHHGPGRHVVEED